MTTSNRDHVLELIQNKGRHLRKWPGIPQRGPVRTDEYFAKGRNWEGRHLTPNISNSGDIFGQPFQQQDGWDEVQLEMGEATKYGSMPINGTILDLKADANESARRMESPMRGGDSELSE